MQTVLLFAPTALPTEHLLVLEPAQHTTHVSEHVHTRRRSRTGWTPGLLYGPFKHDISDGCFEADRLNHSKVCIGLKLCEGPYLFDTRGIGKLLSLLIRPCVYKETVLGDIILYRARGLL